MTFGRRRDDVRDDVDAEVASHLEARTESLMASGLSETEARAQAEREFGDIDDARRYMSRISLRTDTARRRRDYVGDFRQDVRYALRRLIAAPAFTATGILTLALGIGATTAIFSIVYGVLFRPLPFADPDRLYTIYSANRTANSFEASVSSVDIDDWRAMRRDIEDLGGVLYLSGSTGVDLIGRGDPRRIPAAYVTPGYFETLRLVPVVGRLPREDEMVRGGNDKVLMLSHEFWRREFGGVGDVVGTSINIGATPHLVLGVLPASMRYPADDIAVYIPWSSVPDTSTPHIRPVRLMDVVARAKPGVTQAMVEAEMTTITRRLADQYPENRNWDGATVVPLARTVSGSVRDALLVLLGAVGLVLLMAAANVAALQVARASTRGRELAVRLALGARRGRLVRQLLTESLVLSLVGCLVGVGLAFVLVRGLLALAAGQLPRSGEVGIDLAAIVFAVAVSLVTGLVFGLAPALRAMGADPHRALGAGARGAVGADSQRLRNGLVVAEVAVALMLVVGAGLMSRTFIALMNVDPGFNPDGLVAVQFTINPDRHAAPPDPSLPGYRGYMAVYREIIDKVRTLPGVASAAAVKNAPFRGNGEGNGFTIAGRPVPAGQDAPTARVIHVSDGYFQTIGARVVDGREYTPRDRAGAPLVLVVNEAFGRQFFPGERVVGQRLQFGQTQVEIVGVVNDIRQVAMAQPARPTIYMSNLQNGRVQTTIVARTAGDPMSVVPAIREAIWSIDKDQPITDVYTFRDSIARAMARPRLLVVLLGGFGIVGLLLGAIGIYGVLAALVNQRQREIGVRIALGARPSDVLGLVVRRGLMLTIAGLSIGLAGAWGLSRFLAAVLYGVEPTDPATFAGVTAILTLAALLASWIPAQRAARVDPVDALRAE
ncbi:MAG TPA: ABC transporter permease [Vicinamibacterales bacterium]|nr:ABC transporter permease [Vicinamibacterales bacterium]